jgi:stage II sporulation protein M
MILNFLSKKYKSSLNYLKQSKKFLWFSLAIFFLSLIIGILFPIFFKNQIFSFISSLKDQIAGLNPIELIFFIFYNNLKASFFVLILGIFFAIFPLIMTLINGYVIGFVLNYSIALGGLVVIWRIFPHGIFEIPAILISSGLGIKIGYDLISNLTKKQKKKSLKNNFIKSIEVFIFIVIPLLIIAAVIEGILIFLIK